ncbi:hypothetical protein INR49_023199 [Caranx melampygus]|nr:hypothetical protein INR49_023199 [Caranx melampygus]
MTDSLSSSPVETGDTVPAAAPAHRPLSKALMDRRRRPLSSEQKWTRVSTGLIEILWTLNLDSGPRARPRVQTQSPDSESRPEGRTPQKKKRQEREGGVKEASRGSIKTSSLFRHNPDIPELHRPAVTQVKEKIFTTDSFSELNLHPHLRQTIPALLSGRDAVVRSQTGSGKTLSYAVPLVQTLQSVQPKVSRSDGPLAVIIVPPESSPCRPSTPSRSFSR